ncbi:transcription factor RF2b-like [Wolffia australiana]
MVGTRHRRGQSQLEFRTPEDLSQASGDRRSSGFDEIEMEDDPFCTFMDMEKIESKLDAGGTTTSSLQNRENWVSEEADRHALSSDSMNYRPKHRYSNSVDGSIMFLSTPTRSGCSIGEAGEAKKAMPPEKLAELAALDPKRAKRILANRLSAARSKERKARYISELEQKVQALQTEATTLSAQLTLYERDTQNLTSENTELKVRCQAMEQQAQLSDALSRALKLEMVRLKIATGEMSSPHNPDHGTFCESLLTSSHRQSCNSQSHRSSAPSINFSDFLWPQDPICTFQDLDINGGSCMAKSESPAMSATESSTTY